MAPSKVLDVLLELHAGLKHHLPEDKLAHAGVTVLVFAYRPDESIHALLDLFFLFDWSHFLNVNEKLIWLKVALLVATFQEKRDEFCLRTHHIRLLILDF